MDNMPDTSAIWDIANAVVESREEWLEDVLRSNEIHPPIKGEITKGKLRWRGISFCIQNNLEWVEQRGRKIYPMFMWEM